MSLSGAVSGIRSGMKSANRALADQSSAAKDAVLEDMGVADPSSQIVLESNQPGVGTGPANYHTISESDKRHLAAKHNLADGSMGIPVTTQKDLDMEAERLAHMEQFKKDAFIRDRDQFSPILVEKQAASLRSSLKSQAVLAETFLQGGKRGRGKTQEQWDALYSFKTGQTNVSPWGVHLQGQKSVHEKVPKEADPGTLENLFSFVFPKQDIKSGRRIVKGKRRRGPALIDIDE